MRRGQLDKDEEARMARRRDKNNKEDTDGKVRTMRRQQRDKDDETRMKRQGQRGEDNEERRK